MAKMNISIYVSFNEPITEGVYCFFKFKDGSNTKWYKSVRLGIRGKWPRIPNNVMTDWNENNEILIETNYKFTTFLKSFPWKLHCEQLMN